MAISPEEFKIRAKASFALLKGSPVKVKKVTKSPDYKPKYKSLSKKDKQEAKYISKTTPAQRQFNSVAGDVVSTIAAPLGALKVLPKATRVVKELATKFKNKSLTDADKAFYSGANKTPEDKAINKMLQEYTKKQRANK